MKGRKVNGTNELVTKGIPTERTGSIFLSCYPLLPSDSYHSVMTMKNLCLFILPCMLRAPPITYVNVGLHQAKQLAWCLPNNDL